jgi:hypothetical protein
MKHAANHALKFYISFRSFMIHLNRNLTITQLPGCSKRFHERRISKGSASATCPFEDPAHILGHRVGCAEANLCGSVLKLGGGIPLMYLPLTAKSWRYMRFIWCLGSDSYDGKFGTTLIPSTSQSGLHNARNQIKHVFT